MKIAIVNTLPVPSGNASVNRFLGYGKELYKKGVEVNILSSASFEDSILDGLKIYSCGKGKGKIGALIGISSKVCREQYDVVILISNSLLLIYPLWFICRIHKIKLLQEKSEYPFVLMKKGLFKRIYAKFYVNTTYYLFDGLIVMTKSLMEYFKDRVKKNCQLFEMPMTVDTERFVIKKQHSKYGDYIAYCGNMAGNKDGVMNLIGAFNIASPQIPNVKLLLIGGSSNQVDWDNIVNSVKTTNNENIILYGKVSRDEIPVLLKNAKALALARPSSLQSTGGFPTKLGEYLATGNPVVVTAVGDIPQYLNETNAYVVKPDNNEAFACALINVFSNYEKAEQVGLKGQKLAQTVFSAKVQSKRLLDYLKTICE